jgi:hypothetical protein
MHLFGKVWVHTQQPAQKLDVSHVVVEYSYPGIVKMIGKSPTPIDWFWLRDAC